MRKKITSLLLAAFILLSMLPVLASAAQVSLPDLKSKSYESNLNPYTAAGYKNACTWYAWGRAHEVLGVKLPAWSNAITWYESARNAGYTVGSEPRAGSIAVWSGSGGYGHVAYVEEVASTYVHVTEGGWSGSGGGYAGNPQCHSERVPIERMRKGVVRHPTSWHNDALIGFIYLRGMDTTPPVISSIAVSEVSSAGYTVSCVVTDDLSVGRVQFGTYVAKKGKKTLPKTWLTDGRFSGTNIEGSNTYVFRVNDADYGSARGEYCTLITAFDTDGNKRTSRLLRTNVKNDAVEAARVVLGSSTYILYNDTITYEAALKRCEAAGGQLAAITSHKEQKAVESLLAYQPRDAYFIGGDKLTGSWQWMSGEPFTYSRWAARQPDGSPGNNVITMLQGGKNVKAGTWAAAPSNRKATGYIMEIGPAKNGWERQAGKLYYYQNNKRLTGWQQIGGKTFYLSESADRTVQGSVLTGWQTIKGRVFYFNPSKTAGRSGAMFSGWQKINGKRYYFSETGKFGVNLGSMASGWKKVKGKTFYFNESGSYGVKGRLMLGWRTIEGKTYFLRSSGKDGDFGAAAAGWQTIKGKQFYFKTDKNGRPYMLTGWNKINGGWHYFMPTGTSANRGRMLAGLRTIEGKIYYLNTSKTSGTYGMAATGWTTIKDNVYYFAPEGKAGEAGAAYTGKQVIEGKSYTFDEKGICKNPPVFTDNKG